MCLQIGGGDGHDHAHHDDHDHHHVDTATAAPPAGLAGLALVAGFLLMMFLDQAQSHGHDHHHHHLGHAHCSDDDTLAPPEKKATSATGTSAPAIPAPGTISGAGTPVSGHVIPPSDNGKGKLGTVASVTNLLGLGATSPADRAVLGLLVHCASDGLALGSAFLSGNAALSFVVGAAMVLHKAPMAFGLTSYLQSCRWPWPKAQRTLIIFSATAPASSVLTYTLLSAVPMFTTPTAVSLAILFSGGTFLHASTMHILPELQHSNAAGKFSVEQLGAVAVGCVLPALLMWGHHH
jgi:zinc transporter 9